MNQNGITGGNHAKRDTDQNRQKCPSLACRTWIGHPGLDKKKRMLIK